MSPKIKVCLLGLICLIFSFYGHFVCEKVISNFVKSDQCFRNVTYELSPLFDTHTITIVDSQVKAANGLISFDQLCKNMVLAEDNIKKFITSFGKKATSEEEKKIYEELKKRCEISLSFTQKVKDICKEQDSNKIAVLIENGEMYKATDPMLELINASLEKELILSSKIAIDSVASLELLKKFMAAFIGLSIVMSVSTLIPAKSSKKPRKRVK
jgi:hypothetical protein